MRAPRRTRHRAGCAVPPTSRKHCDVCTMDERNADAPLAAEGSMVPSGTPGSFRAAMRQCRPDRQRQHISAAYPRNTLPWQHSAVVRFRGSSRGEIMPWCVPGRRSVAAFSLHAFPKGPRTGKAPVRGNISPPCIQNELALARYARHASEKPRKRAFGDAPREYLAMKGPFRCASPSDHARRADLAVVRRLDEKGSGKAKKLPAF